VLQLQPSEENIPWWCVGGVYKGSVGDMAALELRLVGWPGIFLLQRSLEVPGSILFLLWPWAIMVGGCGCKASRFTTSMFTMFTSDETASYLFVYSRGLISALSAMCKQEQVKS